MCLIVICRGSGCLEGTLSIRIGQIQLILCFHNADDHNSNDDDDAAADDDYIPSTIAQSFFNTKKKCGIILINHSCGKLK